jgi:2-phospho-L-lactate guanylyltransferase (CobY/MobA/RfbA family)
MAAKKNSRSAMRRELGKNLGDAVLTKLDSLAKAGVSAIEADKAIMQEIERHILKTITPPLTRAIKATVNRSIKTGVRKAIKSKLPAIKSRAIKSRAIKSRGVEIKSSPGGGRSTLRH